MDDAVAPRRIRVFFYGLFMDVDLLRSRGADPVNVRTASVPGCSLRIGQRATLIRDPEGCAFGIVMELTHAEVDALYSEPSVRMYKPEAVTACLDDGSFAAALCWNVVDVPAPGEKNVAYATALRELARRLELPAHYTDAIR